jgi:hypothetical protein
MKAMKAMVRLVTLSREGEPLYERLEEAQLQVSEGCLDLDLGHTYLSIPLQPLLQALNSHQLREVLR